MTTFNSDSAETNLKYLREKVASFVAERDWQKYQDPKNLAESLCIEAAELLQIFQWIDKDDLQKYGLEKIKPRVSEELADVMIYCLSLANSMKIGMTEAILDKIEKNRRKYPPHVWKGKVHLDNPLK